MLKKTFFLGLIIAAAGILFSPVVFAQGVQDFKFESFNGTYYLHKNDASVGELTITEELTAVFPDFDQNRGIERAIPKKYKDAPLNIDIEYVKDEQGNSRPYTTYDSDGFLVIRIGEPSVFVQGRQVYEIKYSVTNVISFYDDYDELFWDINGTGWSQPFDEVSATFYVPEAIAGSLRAGQDCYVGIFGSTNTCEAKRDEVGNFVRIQAAAKDLRARETVSVALGFDNGEFKVDPWIQRRKVINLVGLLGLPLLALLHSYNQWYKNGRDVNKRGYVTPHYVPPAGLNVVSSDVIVQEKLTLQGISAGILQLATLGFITITDKVKKRKIFKDKHSVSLTLNKELSSAPKELQEIGNALFTGGVGDTVKLDSEKNKLYTASQKMMKDIPKSLARSGYFKVAPSKARTSWAGKSLLVGLVSIPVFITGIFPLVGTGLIAAGVVMLFWTNAMPARTALGSQKYDEIKGLEEYIKLAEADRIEFHQGLEGSRYGGEQVNDNEFNLRIFEELLPYSLLFGLSKEWSEQFKDLYQQPPDWYNSNATTFNSLLLADSLSSMQSAAQTAFTPPSSSGSSGGSGFGGGGFSGGGGGGGGGGGW